MHLLKFQLKGPGKKLHFKIGQRDELSHLDIAQIRDVYYCNKKEAEGKGIFRILKLKTYKSA